MATADAYSTTGLAQAVAARPMSGALIAIPSAQAPLARPATA